MCNTISISVAFRFKIWALWPELLNSLISRSFSMAPFPLESVAPPAALPPSVAANLGELAAEAEDPGTALPRACYLLPTACSVPHGSMAVLHGPRSRPGL